MVKLENILEIISEKLIKGEGEEVEKFTKEALNRGIALKIY